VVPGASSYGLGIPGLLTDRFRLRLSTDVSPFGLHIPRDAIGFAPGTACFGPTPTGATARESRLRLASGLAAGSGQLPNKRLNLTRPSARFTLEAVRRAG
jgi:hypothetical protein